MNWLLLSQGITVTDGILIIGQRWGWSWKRLWFKGWVLQIRRRSIIIIQLRLILRACCYLILIQYNSWQDRMVSLSSVQPRLSIPDAKGANKFSKANNKLMDYQKLKFKDAVAAFIIWGNKFSDMIRVYLNWISVLYHLPFPCFMSQSTCHLLNRAGFTKNRTQPATCL